MRLDYQDPASLKETVEALIFASDEPLSAVILRSLILDEPTRRPVGAPAADADTFTPPAEETAEDAPQAPSKKKNLLDLEVLRSAIELLNSEYEATGRAFRIIEIAGGYQFATLPEQSVYVSRLYRERARRRLSGAALETLAIVAYKQPVSKADIENIRGVNCDEVLKSLLEKNLVTITGRADSVGRPLLYGTTDEFLRQFGLPSMRDLPKPREIEEMLKEEAVKATTLEEAANEFVDPDAEQETVTIDEVIAVSKEGRPEEASDAEARYADTTQNGAEETADTREAVGAVGLEEGIQDRDSEAMA